MLRFCASMITDFERMSIATLKGYLYQMMEEYLEIFETEAANIVLYYTNKPKFEKVILIAIDKYRNILKQRQQAAQKRALKDYQWEVPEERAYDEHKNVALPQVEDHALLPFVKSRQASNPEERFENYLEERKELIDWWYKNGDQGKQHYAIPYTRSDGATALFYVDFVVRMKTGDIYLFDTKSEDSDPEAPNKHNALVDYMAERNARGEHLQGGVIIEDHGLWKYCTMKIENTSDLRGWEVL